MRMLFAGSLLAACACTAPAQSFFWDFNNVGGATTNGQSGGGLYEAQGWFFQNNSSSPGTTDWFQGNTGIFPPHSGNGYIAANFNNQGITYGHISNWMLSPPRSFANGNTVRFWTRTVPSPGFPDGLEVRLSMNGASTNVGVGPGGLGDFTTLLVSVNPNFVTSPYPLGYPTTWTQISVTLSGIPSGTIGRIGFRYYGKQAGSGPTTINSDYIGIDDFEVF